MKQIEIHGKVFRFKNYDNFDYYCTDTICDGKNNVIEVKYARINPNGKLPNYWRSNIHTTRDIEGLIPNEALNGPYEPATEGDYKILKTLVPDAMDDCTREALTHLKESLGNDVAGFVCNRLHMTESELCDALAAEQIDSVAMAIYNIESRQMGMIIGDQTGVGKGRQAASIIRYGLLNGYLPIFVTARANLMSDIYRDCKALGIADKKPFIVNSDGKVVDFSQKTEKANDVSEEEMEQRADETEDEYNARIMRLLSDTYKEVYSAGDKKYFKTKGEIPRDCEYVMTTYSQFNRKGDKCQWALALTENHKCIVVMDEAHKAAGAVSATGLFFQEFLSKVSGCIYLSATYAKRPDNMALYAKNTFIQQTDLDAEKLMQTILNGGIPMQEVLSDALVRNGQMVRREHDNSGVNVDYIHLNKDGANEFGVTDTSEADRANMDVITELMRTLISVQEEYVAPKKFLREEAIRIGAFYDKGKCFFDVGKEVKISKFSIFANIFNLVESILLAIKSKSVAMRAISHVKEGKKVVICLAKTNETTIKNAKVGEVINGSFAMSLMPILGNLLKCQFRAVIDDTRSAEAKEIIQNLLRNGYEIVSQKGIECVLIRKTDARELDPKITSSYDEEYESLKEEISKVGSEIPLCPIDYMRYFLDKEGVKYGECTGRKLRVKYNSIYTTEAKVEAKEKSDTSKIFDEFQRNKLDVLIINSTAATGASCHAVPAAGMKNSEVKPRVMIVAQAELDVNTEVQKRGRVNRTGQIYKPSYEYIITDIPAESRMMLILRKKLASLDANTSSNKEQNADIINVRDLDNHYGDEAVSEWLKENPQYKRWLDFMGKTSVDFKSVSGRIALLDCAGQEVFYDFVYNDFDERINSAKANHTYDLQTEVYNYKGTLISSKIVDYGWGGVDFFGGNTIENTYRCVTENWALGIDAIKTKIKANFGNSDLFKTWKDKFNEKFDASIENLNKKISDSQSKDDLNLDEQKRLYANLRETEALKDLIEKWLNEAIRLCDLPIDERLKSCFGAITLKDDDNKTTKEVYCFWGELKLTGDTYTPGSLSATFYTPDTDVSHSFNFAAGTDIYGNKNVSKMNLVKFRNINDTDFANTWNRQREANHIKVAQKTILTGNIMRGMVSPRYAACGKQTIKFSDDKGNWQTGLLIDGDKVEQKINYPLTPSIVGHVLSQPANSTLTGPIAEITLSKIGEAWKFMRANVISNYLEISGSGANKLIEIFKGKVCDYEDAKLAMNFLCGLHFNVLLYEHGINEETAEKAQQEFNKAKMQSSDIWKKLWDGSGKKPYKAEKKNEADEEEDDMELLMLELQLALALQEQEKIDWANILID